MMSTNKEDLEKLINDLTENKLSAGSVFHIKPGYIQGYLNK